MGPVALTVDVHGVLLYLDPAAFGEVLAPFSCAPDERAILKANCETG